MQSCMGKSGLNSCSDKVSDFLCVKEDGRNLLYFLCKNMKYRKMEMSFICRTASQFHLCVQNTTTGSVNMALERNQRAAGELQASDRVPLICMSLWGMLWIVKCSYTVMCHLTTGIRSEKYVVRRFRRSANVIKCTYTILEYSPLHTSATCYSLLLLGYKHVQQVTAPNAVVKCKTIII
jgi:hypothetical protein